MISLAKNWYRFLHPKFQTIHLDYPVQLKPRYSIESEAHPKLLDLVSRKDSVYHTLLADIVRYKDVYSTWGESGENQQTIIPQWDNGYLPALDMMTLYTMVAQNAPKRIVEIGSGYSTKIIRSAIRDQNLNSKIISIDPMPRAAIDVLSDQIIRKGLEDCDINEISSELEAGDMLFIDNSHRILPNSDATVVFTELLHELRQGVIVHIHDIYIPYDYPQFMCDRYYSEQYGLMIAMLSNPDRYQSLFPAYYISQTSPYKEKLDPIWTLTKLTNGEKHGGSFWLLIS